MISVSRGSATHRKQEKSAESSNAKAGRQHKQSKKEQIPNGQPIHSILPYWAGVKFQESVAILSEDKKKSQKIQPLPEGAQP